MLTLKYELIMHFNAYKINLMIRLNDHYKANTNISINKDIHGFSNDIKKIIFVNSDK